MTDDPAMGGATPPRAELGPCVIAFLIDWVGVYVAMFVLFATSSSSDSRTAASSRDPLPGAA